MGQSDLDVLQNKVLIHCFIPLESSFCLYSQEAIKLMRLTIYSGNLLWQ